MTAAAESWDDRTESVTLQCLGGPRDGDTLRMQPGHRTYRVLRQDHLTTEGYYEVMRYRGGYAMVWHPAGRGSAWWLHVAARNQKHDTTGQG